MNHFISFQELHKKIEGFWLISDPMMQLQFEVKVLIADLKALLNPAAVSDALKSYQEIEMFALNKVSSFLFQKHSEATRFDENTLKELIFMDFEDFGPDLRP